jgi:hypothetical protein
MTEEEWATTTDMSAVFDLSSGSFSTRKLRLFATACCRQNWELLTDDRERRLVEVAERLADGEATHQERTSANAGLDDFCQEDRERSDFKFQTILDGSLLLDQFDSGIAWYWAFEMQCPPFKSTRSEKERVAEQAAILRDLFGNPFRPVAFDPRWRTADAVGLARGIYDERAFDRLPFLADALMDAGCADEQVLGHCRSDGPHVRGCWVVDLVLGKG